MFVNAIDIAARFTRPIHTIERLYASQDIYPGAATLFFVNDEGWALTCKHVANTIAVADQILARRAAFESELSAHKGKKKENQARKELEKKFNLNKREIFEIRNVFFNCVEGKLDLEIKFHQDYDLALIHFRNFSRLLCDRFPVFPIDSSGLKQGKYLCRLGFPFSEFSNFAYDVNLDTIGWTNIGRSDSPSFPIEGMLTRHLSGPNGEILGFELSTPGIRGQSGGPAFDVDGKVWGMQFATNHLDLNFDVNMEVIRGGEKKKVKDSAFLHVGHCIHVEVLKNFMKHHGVSFVEG